jgi:hypothetical protein
MANQYEPDALEVLEEMGRDARAFYNVVKSKVTEIANKGYELESVIGKNGEKLRVMLGESIRGATIPFIVTHAFPWISDWRKGTLFDRITSPTGKQKKLCAQYRKLSDYSAGTGMVLGAMAEIAFYQHLLHKSWGYAMVPVLTNALFLGRNWYRNAENRVANREEIKQSPQ